MNHLSSSKDVDLKMQNFPFLLAQADYLSVFFVMQVSTVNIVCSLCTAMWMDRCNVIFLCDSVFVWFVLC